MTLVLVVLHLLLGVALVGELASLTIIQNCPRTNADRTFWFNKQRILISFASYTYIKRNIVILVQCLLFKLIIILAQSSVLYVNRHVLQSLTSGRVWLCGSAGLAVSV